jgi:Family of unknown function (DUF6455)
MEINLLQILQYGGLVLALGLFVWVALVIRRHYKTTAYPIRLSQMMRRLGIRTRDVEALHYGVHLPTTARLCDGCTSKEDCDAWLAAQSGGPAPEFCPNAQFFRLVAGQSEHTA